jgi:hypothetical protein
MSDDDFADFDLEATVEGAAADSTDSEMPYAALPRLLRYAIAARRDRPALRERLLAEIVSSEPALIDAATAWATFDDQTGCALAAILDKKAVENDRVDFRSYSDVVRLLSAPVDAAYRIDHRRIAVALALCQSEGCAKVDGALRAEVAEITIGWAFVAAGAHRARKSALARHLADDLGKKRTKAISEEAVRDERATWEAKEKEGRTDVETDVPVLPPDAVPTGFVRVCDMSASDRKSPKTRDIIRGHEHAIGTDLPLISTPDLKAVREQLIFEFPYAAEVVDFALGDLVGRETVLLRPLLLVGRPGGGKSRFARRLAEVVGVGIWRTDASQSDGAIFGGTPRRWSTAEPCHSFLAVSRARHGNPLIVIDEIEKAGTRSDYGRLWDCLLGLLEPETAMRYPDPALQCDLDLSHVSYVATANNLEPLPPALRDRFRVVEFPEPRAADLDSLLPAVLASLASERGLDDRWVTPIAGWERELIAANWRGGSVRRLRRYVEAVLRARELDAPRNSTFGVHPSGWQNASRAEAEDEVIIRSKIPRRDFHPARLPFWGSHALARIH